MVFESDLCQRPCRGYTALFPGNAPAASTAQVNGHFTAHRRPLNWLKRRSTDSKKDETTQVRPPSASQSGISGNLNDDHYLTSVMADLNELGWLLTDVAMRPTDVRDRETRSQGRAQRRAGAEDPRTVQHC